MDTSSSEKEQTLLRLVTAYETELLRLCCVILGDPHLAQDAVQETFFKVYRTLDRFRGECSEKTWITRIAVNTCRDMKRQRWFRFIDRSVSADMLPDTPIPCPQEQSELFLDIINLSEKHKEVILLHYYQQLSLEETAQALHISKRTVSYRLDKARALLRMELGKEDEV